MVYGTFDGNTNLGRCSDTLRLHVRLVRAYQTSGVTQERFITAACDDLQTGLPRYLRRALHLDSEVLSKLVEVWGAQKETKTTLS